MNTRTVVTVLVLLAVVALAVASRVRSRPIGGSLFSRVVKVDQLWIMPALVVLVCLAIIALGPAPTLGAMAVWLAALAIGAGLGWVRGKSLRIEVHPETAEVRSHAGGAFLGLIIVLVAIRWGLRAWLLQNPTTLPIGATHLTDAFLVMAVGIVAVQRLEMWLRARRLLAARVGRLASTFE